MTLGSNRGVDPELDFPHSSAPARGTPLEVAPGVLWLRMPLPFALDHINLWALDDGAGWTLVDTGMADAPTRALWADLLSGPLAGKPVTRVLCTHFHPDHMGLTRSLTDPVGAGADLPARAVAPGAMLWASLGEWAYGRMLAMTTDTEFVDFSLPFYRRAGMDAEGLALVQKRGNAYAQKVEVPPAAFHRLHDGDVVPIGGRDWRVVVGRGHAPEHLALWCEAEGLVISGDQILPKITPNISIWPSEPDANPLKAYLETITRFIPMGADALVLPSHKLPFRGLPARVATLEAHHRDRLDDALAACAVGAPTAVEMVGVMFRRALDNHQLFFALGEALAHIHWLEAEGLVAREETDGVARFRRV